MNRLPEKRSTILVAVLLLFTTTAEVTRAQSEPPSPNPDEPAAAQTQDKPQKRGSLDFAVGREGHTLSIGIGDAF